jgi:hypothetical protein
MRRLVVLAIAGAAVAAAAPASFAAPTLPGCGAYKPGPGSCVFTIVKSDAIPAGVLASTTWQVKSSAGKVLYSGKAGTTTIKFKAGKYTLLVTGKNGFAGAGKLQGKLK